MIAGIYITDDYIDVLAGHSVALDHQSDLPFLLDEGQHSNIRFEQYALGSNEKSIRAAFLMAAKSLQAIARDEPLTHVGVGCYGPFKTINHAIPENDRARAGYGAIGEGLHVRLRGIDLYGTLLKAFAAAGFANVPSITIQTDANVAALGELYNRHMRSGRWEGGGKDQVIAFLKFSHGVGGGVVYGHELWAGRLHPEMGQVRVPRWPGLDHASARMESELEGVCRFHTDCIEGLSNIESFKHRWGESFDQLKKQSAAERRRHPAWEREAYYAAQLCVSLVCLFSPGKIVLGGRIMAVPGMVENVRSEFGKLMKGRGIGFYPDYADVHSETFIDTNSDDKYGGKPGVIGALGLAALLERSGPPKSRGGGPYLQGNVVDFANYLPRSR